MKFLHIGGSTVARFSFVIFQQAFVFVELRAGRLVTMWPAAGARSPLLPTSVFAETLLRRNCATTSVCDVPRHKHEIGKYEINAMEIMLHLLSKFYQDLPFEILPFAFAM